ncbi:MAG TPA: 2-amino-4-hydroxy-6-hydroxymethyldihydropteridine diphosphokinase [Dehalococcoidia bacterium]|nr:2-amino-4-hydroxy-6-hydroxymethyldihydropteridine diphosphokinase [Dehalococcoidia bacterium]
MNGLPVVYLGLGSNLGNREANLRLAIRWLEPLVRVEAASSLYETAPVGTGGPPFYNAVVRVVTGLTPQALLRHAKNVEWDIGRRPAARWAPRPIDIDLLVFGDETVNEPDLVVPHPLLGERAFVLVPLAELAPDLKPPGAGATVSELLSRLDASGVAKVRGPEWVEPALALLRR